MENLAKIEFAAFVNLTMVARDKNDKSTLVRLRINPTHITSYYEAFDAKRGDKPVTAICVGGVTYWIDMTVEEVDEMMDKIERSVSFKE